MLLLELQNASVLSSIPEKAAFDTWLSFLLSTLTQPIELTIRLVDEDEMTQLNHEFRGKNRPTNVLAFPYDMPIEEEPILLGDIVLCVPVVLQEAKEQQKSLEAHFAHLTIHAGLHLLGYDHEETEEAEEMEALEVELLAKLGYPNPYTLT